MKVEKVFLFQICKSRDEMIRSKSSPMSIRVVLYFVDELAARWCLLLPLVWEIHSAQGSCTSIYPSSAPKTDLGSMQTQA